MKLFRPYNPFRWLVLGFFWLLPAGLVLAQPRSSAPLLKNETSPQKNLKVFDAMWNTVNQKYFDVKFNGIDWGAVREQYRPLAEKADYFQIPELSPNASLTGHCEPCISVLALAQLYIHFV